MHTQEKATSKKNKHKKVVSNSAFMSSMSPTIVQAKLEMTEPGDSYEREADMMADMVMSRKSAKSIRSEISGIPSHHISRVPSGQHSSAISPGLESAISSSRGSGFAMPSSLRSQMEGSFGADFSGIRLHTDSAANEMSSSINAKAFTCGKDIYFGAGQYNPHSESGQHLIAHELTHTLQQGKFVARKDDFKIQISYQDFISNHLNNFLDEDIYTSEFWGFMRNLRLGQTLGLSKDKTTEGIGNSNLSNSVSALYDLLLSDQSEEIDSKIQSVYRRLRYIRLTNNFKIQHEQQFHKLQGTWIRIDSKWEAREDLKKQHPYIFWLSNWGHVKFDEYDFRRREYYNLISFYLNVVGTDLQIESFNKKSEELRYFYEAKKDSTDSGIIKNAGKFETFYKLNAEYVYELHRKLEKDVEDNEFAAKAQLYFLYGVSTVCAITDAALVAVALPGIIGMSATTAASIKGSIVINVIANAGTSLIYNIGTYAGKRIADDKSHSVTSDILIPTLIQIPFSIVFGVAGHYISKVGDKILGQAASQVTGQAANQGAKQATTQAVKQTAAQTGKTATTQATTQAVKQTAAQTGKTATTQAAEQAMSQAPKKLASNATGQAIRNAESQVISQTASQAVGNAESQVINQATSKASSQAVSQAENIANKMISDAVSQADSQVASQAVKETTTQVVKEATKQATKQTTSQAVEQTAKNMNKINPFTNRDFWYNMTEGVAQTGVEKTFDYIQNN